MKTFRRIVVPILGILFLASAVFAGSTSTWTRHAREVDPAKAPAGPSSIWTTDHYKAIPLVSVPWPTGLGVSVTGDTVYINSWTGNAYRYRPGQALEVGSGAPPLLAGRLWGKYYFGMDGGFVGYVGSGLSFDIFMFPFGPDLETTALDVDRVTGIVYFAITDWYNGYCVFFKYTPSTGTVDYLFDEDYSPCYGIAVRGNYVYFSFEYDDVVLRVDKRAPGGRWQLVAEGLNGPDDIQFDAKGNMFVAEWDSGTIASIPAGTTKVKRIASGFFGPGYLGMDKYGNVYVSEYAGGVVWELKKIR